VALLSKTEERGNDIGRNFTMQVGREVDRQADWESELFLLWWRAGDAGRLPLGL